MAFYIQKGHNIINKSVHHTINVNFTEAKLFVIRYRIDEAIKIYNTLKIIIITDAISAAKQIFDTSVYLYKLHLITTSKNLREFFNKNPNNSILFWDYPDCIKWSPHVLVDKASKSIQTNSILLCRTSWEFSRKEECNSIICR